MNIKKIARERMKELGISERRLARYLQTDRSTLRRWLYDTRRTRETLPLVLDALDLEIVPRTEPQSGIYCEKGTNTGKGMDIRKIVRKRMGELDISIRLLAHYLRKDRSTLNRWLNPPQRKNRKITPLVLDALDLEIVPSTEPQSGIYNAKEEAEWRFRESLKHPKRRVREMLSGMR